MDLGAVLPFNAGCTKGLIKQNGCIAYVLCVVFFSSFKPSPGAMALKSNPSFQSNLIEP